MNLVSRAAFDNTSQTTIFPDHPSFPPELLLIIFKYIQIYPHNSFIIDSPDYKLALTSLRACACVSRLWYPHARQVLYEYPQLINGALLLFRSTIGSSPSHATLVKSLDIIPPRNEPLSLVNLIHELPNLRSVSINKPLADPALTPDAMNLLVQGPPIESFLIRAPASLVINFISCWPSLRFLEVSTRGPTNIVIDLPPPKFKLYELRWDVDLLVDKDLIDAEWALSNSFDSVNILHFRKPITPAFFQRLVSDPNNTLRSLKFVYFPTGYFPLLPLCTRLEDLSILDTLQTELLQALPLSVQHLEFVTTHSNLPIDAFRAFLASHKDLHTLTIHDWKCLCAEHKEILIELIVRYDLNTVICEYPPWVLPEDGFMAPVTKFPRYNALNTDAYQVLHRREVS